jgi:glycosyltransferase involved in cell wall biosynthesis
MAGADRGGAETAFVDMCIAMKARGVTQHIITRANDLRVPRLRDAGLPVTTLPLGGAIDIYSPYKIKQIIKDFKPNIVQTWMARAAWKTPASDKKTYLNVARLGGYYDLKYFKTSDYFVTITPLIRDYLIEHGIEPSRVQHINNFAETETVSALISRAALNTPDDAFVCLALSRYHYAKALDTLIKSIVTLPNVHLWLAGEGPDRTLLEQLTRDLNLESRVHFLGWRSDRAALLRASNACVFPSRHEPFGTVFVQAWAQKTPVICSTADGPRQFVRHGIDGLLFPIDDVDALTNSIAQLQSDQSFTQELVQNGFARYENEFTAHQCVDQYLKYYDDILRRESIIR